MLDHDTNALTNVNTFLPLLLFTINVVLLDSRDVKSRSDLLPSKSGCELHSDL